MMKRVMSLFLASPVVVLIACSGGNSDGSGRGLSMAATAPLNDTGITLCGDYAYTPGSGAHNNNLICSNQSTIPTMTSDGAEYPVTGGDPIPRGQDALYGRDAEGLTDSNSDGFKGFELIKLDNDGVPLPDQTQPWDVYGGEFNSTQWSCVRDEVTDLVWEVKTNHTVADLRDKDWIYTWFDDNSATNGGNQGTPDAIGTGSTAGNCFSQSKCDTKKYVQDVNASYLCGGDGWRLPSRDELKTLRHLGVTSPAIEHDYFPNTPAANFWTSTPRADVSSDAWTVDFIDGGERQLLKSQAYTVRLVRNAN